MDGCGSGDLPGVVQAGRRGAWGGWSAGSEASVGRNALAPGGDMATTFTAPTLCCFPALCSKVGGREAVKAFSFHPLPEEKLSSNLSRFPRVNASPLSPPVSGSD